MIDAIYIAIAVVLLISLGARIAIMRFNRSMLEIDRKIARLQAEIDQAVDERTHSALGSKRLRKTASLPQRLSPVSR